MDFGIIWPQRFPKFHRLIIVVNSIFNTSIICYNFIHWPLRVRHLSIVRPQSGDYRNSSVELSNMIPCRFSHYPFYFVFLKCYFPLTFLYKYIISCLFGHGNNNCCDAMLECKSLHLKVFFKE